MSTKSRASERELLKMFARMVKPVRYTRGVVVGAGDDAAVLRPVPGMDLLVTTDAMVEGRHFRRAWLSGREIGWRLAAVNLSDIAAMGGRPLYGLMSFAIPRGVATREVTAIERGVRDHLAVFGASIVGGNLSGIDSPLVCDMTLVGSVRRGRAWRRACKPGRDAIVVVGGLGEARAGVELLNRRGRKQPSNRLTRAYKRPVPLLDVPRLLQNEKSVHGAIDVSDGFSTDLIRVCESSGAGCDIETDRFDISNPLRRFCKDRSKNPIEYALHGGEDYALILSIDARKADAVASRIERSLSIPARVVGRFTSRRNHYCLVDATGKKTTLRPHGWDHLSPRR